MAKRARTTRRLEVWLKDTDLALFVLNAQRRLVFFNHGCERLTGWAASDLLGQKCDYVSEPDPNSTAALLAALSPPADAWTGKPTFASVEIPHCEHPSSGRIIHFFPLVDAEEHVNALLGVMIPAPVAKERPPQSSAQQLHAELAALRQSIRRRFGVESLVGRSPAMQRAFAQLELAQAAPSSMLLVGEPGTGKQHLARVMHYRSTLGKRSFVPVDAKTTTRHDLEQLLSHLRTDGQSEDLRTGTLFFENIDLAATDFQVSLSGWLKTEAETTGVRVVAGANRPLLPLVEAERFHQGLFFALTTMQIEIPPLRQRMEDLELLAQYFLEELNRDAAQQVGGFTDDVWRQFRRYNWPGNVGELSRVVREARAACTGTAIDDSHLPFSFRTGVSAQSIGPSQRLRAIPLDELLEQVEREHIEQVLAECKDNKARAAELLGITRPRLYRRMELLGIAGASDTDVMDGEPVSNP